MRRMKQPGLLSGVRIMRRLRFFALVLIAGVGLAGSASAQRRPPAAPPRANPVVSSGPRATVLTSDAWENASKTPVTSAEIDQLVSRELQHAKIQPAPLTSDEEFIRRATLDISGKLPTPAEVKAFVADQDPAKRAKLIDKLLAGDDYAVHWARYWRDVIGSRITEARARGLAVNFEHWLTEEFKQDKSWGDIVRAMITAEGKVVLTEPDKNGAGYFLAGHRGAEAANERAAETARVFLGIQIQCAQCHNHPFDKWQQVQFHELSAYYARLGEQPVRDGQRLVGIELTPRRFGEHQLPSKEDPKQTSTVHPRFLDGKSPPQNLGDKERREALARAIVDKNNYWFAGAYVNRIWGELMGQSFYEPVDDMGPQKEAVFADVLTRLAAAFRATNYDPKELFRAILNSETYQRRIRLGDTSDQHLHFAAAYPTRLHADALWDSLVGVLGQLTPPGAAAAPPGPAGPRGQRPGLEGLFKAEFGFDPSMKPDEIEGSIPQALLLMNNPLLNMRMQARPANTLGRLLMDNPKDDDAIRAVYLRSLARKPTDKEMDRCREHVKKAGSRAEAYEDILWALINSTEFQTKR